jgi:hypothetical protein
MNLKEGNLEFDFIGATCAIKFDEKKFYRDKFNKLPGAKGVDFISLYSDEMILVEVKDCEGHETENRWRIAPNNAKVSTAAICPTDDRESLDIEVAHKVAMTIACLCGANTKMQQSENAKELEKYASFFNGDGIASGRKNLKVILFIEGDFATNSTPEKAVLKRIGDSIEKKLDWIQCKILVENSNTISGKRYKVNRSI